MSAYAKIFNSFLLSILFLSVSVGHCAGVKKLFYGEGVGGEPVGDSTQFDGPLRKLSNFTSSPGWEFTVSYNGGHKNTEEITKTKFKNTRNLGAFTEVNYNAIIDEMISKINNNEVLEKDQLMLVIDTHGAQKEGSEKTHAIALSSGEVTDLKTLEGANRINLDRLETLVELAARKKVKLAIVDMSCFSGNLLNIKNENVCMISGSGTNHYSYSGEFTFPGRFYEQLKPGRNLEDAFLSARVQGFHPDFPMISTDEGQAVDALIYKSLSSYLVFNDSSTNDFTLQYDLQDATNFQAQACSQKSNHEQFKALLEQIKDVYKITGKAGENQMASLNGALKNYRNYQQKYEDAVKSKFEVEAQIAAILERDFADKRPLWEAYSKLDFLTVDYKTQVKQAELRLKNSDTEGNRILTLNLIEKSKQQDLMATKIKSELSSSTLSKLKNYEAVMKKSTDTWVLAKEVSLEARKLYFHLYQQMKSQKSNPCRDFVL